jgi:UDP-N-acetylmuramoylalanine--D-glutamate ligase
VPGRLEKIKTKGGVTFYNDTTATTPHASAAALKALGGVYGKVVTVIGGTDKQIDPSILLETLPKYAKAIIVLPGTGTEIIRVGLDNISKKSGIPVMYVKSLKEAYDKAVAESTKGDAIVLSPGFASFGLFLNEFDRGDQWNALVK